MSLPKITVIGAGNVGATLAQRLVEQNLGNVVLIDIAEGVARGKALDLNQAAPLVHSAARVTGTAAYDETAGSDVIVVTSGSPRKPGMSRDDLLKINYEIVRSVVERAVQVSPQAVIIVVTNPLDAMVYTALKTSGFPAQRVLGMAGVLDSARFRSFLSEALNVSSSVVEATVLGGHGDDMVPCLPLARVAGIPVTQLLPGEVLEAIVQRTRQGGAEIVKLLQTGSAYYAPSAAAARMVAAVLRDEKAVMPCAVWLENSFGFQRQILGVPVVIGRQGAEKIIEIELTTEDRTGLAKSAEAVRELCRQIDSWWK
jgi:malate dehydrogenase